MNYIVTKCVLNDDNLLLLFPPESYQSIDEIYNSDLLNKFFNGKKIYQTKEEDSNEFFIKCVSDERKYIHVLEK